MDSALKSFYDFLKNERALSDSTIASYKSDIEHFRSFYGGDIRKADEASLENYIKSLRLAGKSSSTISRNMVSLRAFYSYITNINIIKSNPISSIKLPKVDKKLPFILNSEEISALLSAPDGNDPKSLRDKAMLELLYATGIRVSELMSLSISSINLRRGMLICPSAGGNRIVPLGKIASAAVSQYLKQGRPALLHGHDDGALFLNYTGTRMTRQGFWKIIKGYSKALGIDKQITPHTLRHSFAAHLLEGGADLESIGEMMGLSDAASTAVYKKLLENKIFDIYKKAHPRA